MGQQNPRMALTVPPDIKKIYDDTAEILGIPTSRLVMQILTEAAPGIKKMGLAVEKAKIEPLSGLHDLDSLLGDTTDGINDLQMDIEDQIKRKKKPK